MRLAQQRWAALTQPPRPPDALGVDDARGGEDTTVLSPRWGVYFGRVTEIPGSRTPDGPSVRDLILPEVGPDTLVNVDVVGVGTSPYDFTKQAHARTRPINFGAGSDARDSTDNYDFANLRAQAYWTFREALDPVRGLGLALPPDEQLVQDLISVGWEPRGGKILIESKKDIKKRIGRSTNKGDAVVQAFMEEEAPTLPPSGIAGYEQDDTYQGGDDW